MIALFAVVIPAVCGVVGLVWSSWIKAHSAERLALSNERHIGIEFGQGESLHALLTKQTDLILTMRSEQRRQARVLVTQAGAFARLESAVRACPFYSDHRFEDVPSPASEPTRSRSTK